MPTLLNMYFDASDVILFAFYAFYILLGLAYCWIAFEFRIDHFVISTFYGVFSLLYEYCDAIFSRLAEYTLHILIVMLIGVLSILIYCYAKARQYRPGRITMKNSRLKRGISNNSGRNGWDDANTRRTPQPGKFKFDFDLLSNIPLLSRFRGKMKELPQTNGVRRDSSPTRSSRWNGRAYEYPAAEPANATRTMQIHNLLNTSGYIPVPDELQAALMERLADTSGRWVHLAVFSKEYEDKVVFLMFRKLDEAKRAFAALHGMWFDGHLVQVQFIEESDYFARYPSAALI